MTQTYSAERRLRRCRTPARQSTRLAADRALRSLGRIARATVLATAREIIDRDGVHGLSMRRLGRDPMSHYRHAPNKAALLDGVAEIVLEQLKVESIDPDWAAA